MAEALDLRRIAGALQREQHRRDAARGKRIRDRERHGAAAAITPTGDEISEAADVMAAALPSSVPVAVVGRKAQRAMLAVADEGEDFRDRRILARQRLHRVQPLGEDAGAVKQLLIERAHGGEPLPW